MTHSRGRHAARAAIGAYDRTNVLGPIAVLVLVAMLWGVAFVVVKATVVNIPPAGLVGWRFGIAALIVGLAKPRCLRGIRRRALADAAVLGALLGAGFLLQTWGIASTSVVVSAFITGSVVALAPLVARVWFGRRLTRAAGFGVGLATAGLALISLRGTSFGFGEMLTLGAAALWAVHLVALEAWVRSGEVYAIAVIQLAVVASMAWVVQAFSVSGVVVPATPSAWVGVICLGAFATGAALLLLTWAQTKVDATTSAIVLTLEPVFGAAVAVAAGGEQFAVVTAIGAAAVVGAALLGSRIGGRAPRARLGNDGPRLHMTCATSSN